jgi:hypothetical protein
MKPDWLARLAPAHAPPPPGWWPPAPGWWGLALLVVLGIAALFYWLNRPPHRLRRNAMRQLARIEQTGHDDAVFARQLEDLVRRYAVARFGRATVAGLAGAAWIDFVVAHGGSDWKGDTGAHLLRAAYGGLAEGDRSRWLAGARGFIRGRA